MPITDLFRQLAGATVPCSMYGYVDSHPKDCRGGCGGTGRIYLFDNSVRVLCPHVVALRGQPTERGIAFALSDEHLERCSGWVASENGWVWIAAVGMAMLVRQMEQGQWEAKDRLQMKVWDGPEAFYSAVLEAVQTLEGVTLG